MEILELANIVRDVVGYEGGIEHDMSKPDGTLRKLLDVSLLESTGWKYKTELKAGIEKVYIWFKERL
jgi:GDP-L-fucose synthase